jgi:hypothetical protein
MRDTRFFFIALLQAAAATVAMRRPGNQRAAAPNTAPMRKTLPPWELVLPHLLEVLRVPMAVSMLEKTTGKPFEVQPEASRMDKKRSNRQQPSFLHE